jgi:hypothetical protein
MKTAQFRLGSVTSLVDLVGGLKKTVNARLTRQFRPQLPAVLIRRAVDEAEQIARGTEFPHLFLPELAAEQVRRVHASLAHDATEMGYSRAA